MHWRGVYFGIIMEESSIDSYANTITRLRKRKLEDEQKVMFLCNSSFKSQRHITEACAEGHAIVHHGLPVHGILTTTQSFILSPP